MTIEQDIIPDNVPHDRIVDFDMYRPAGIEDGYHVAWSRLQSPGTPNLIWTARNGGHWIATRGKWVKEIYSDPEHYSSEVIFLPKAAGELYDMIPTRMDPPEHTPFRRALDKGLNIKEMRSKQDLVRKVAIDLIDAFKNDGRCDFAQDYAQKFPIHVFLALSGLPKEDASMLMAFASGMTRPAGDTPAEKAAVLERANKAFFDYVRPYVEARRGGTGTDLITLVLNADLGDRKMTLHEETGLISLMLLAGLDTVVNFLSLLMIFLAEHPGHVAELAAAPDRIKLGAEELFRRFAMVAEARMVAKDIERDGVHLKRGDMILVPTALAGLDPEMNDHPWEVDFKRRAPQHVTFGAGPHRCAGLHLARMEVIVTLEEWIRRIPRFRLKPGTRPHYASGIIAAIDNVQLEWEF